MTSKGANFRGGEGGTEPEATESRNVRKTRTAGPADGSAVVRAVVHGRKRGVRTSYKLHDKREEFSNQVDVHGHGGSWGHTSAAEESAHLHLAAAKPAASRRTGADVTVCRNRDVCLSMCGVRSDSTAEGCTADVA